LFDSLFGILLDTLDVALLLAPGPKVQRGEPAEFEHPIEGTRLTGPLEMAMVFEFYDPLGFDSVLGGGDLYRQFSELAARDISIEQWARPRDAAVRLERLARSLPGDVGDSVSPEKLLDCACIIAASIAEPEEEADA